MDVQIVMDQLSSNGMQENSGSSDDEQSELLIQDAAIERRDENTGLEFPIHDAACEGRVEDLKEILGPNLLDLSQKLNNTECTPLHSAAMGGNLN